jgi:hypothetical protein
MAFPRVVRNRLQWIGDDGLFALPRHGKNVVPYAPVMALPFGCNMLTSLACEVDRQYDASLAEWLQDREVGPREPQEQPQPSPLGTARACAFRQSNYQVCPIIMYSWPLVTLACKGPLDAHLATSKVFLSFFYLNPSLLPLAAPFFLLFKPISPAPLQLKYHTKKIPVGENSVMLQAIQRLGELAAGHQPYSAPNNDLSPQAQALRLLRIGSNTVAGQQTTGMVLISFIAGGGSTFTASHDHVILDAKPFTNNALLGRPGEVSGQLHGHGRTAFHINNLAVYNDRGWLLSGVECSPFMLWMHYFKTRAGDRILQTVRDQQQQYRMLHQVPIGGGEVQQPAGMCFNPTALQTAFAKVRMYQMSNFCCPQALNFRTSVVVELMESQWTGKWTHGPQLSLCKVTMRLAQHQTAPNSY